MIDGGEPTLPRDTQGGYLAGRQDHVDGVEDLGGAAHLGHQLGLDGAGAFGAHEEHRALAHAGRQRQEQHQHAHAAHPLGQRAPQQHAAGQVGHSGEGGRAGGGQAGDRLEQGVDIAGHGAGEHIGQRPEQGQQHPAERHGYEPVAAVHLCLFHRDQAQTRAHGGAEGGGEQELTPVYLPADAGRQRREQKKSGLHPQDVAHRLRYQSKVHKNTSVRR